MNEKTDVEMGIATVSVADASRMLRANDRTVRRWCTEGKLESRKDGKAFEIELASVLKMLKEDPPAGADSDTESDNGRSVSDGKIVDTENTTETFRQMRAAANEHLQNVNDFHRTLLEDVAALERAVVFEQNRNQEIQDGLDAILKQLNTPAVEVGEVVVDVRPKRGVMRRAWGWVKTKKRRVFAVKMKQKNANKA